MKHFPIEIHHNGILIDLLAEIRRAFQVEPILLVTNGRLATQFGINFGFLSPKRLRLCMLIYQNPINKILPNLYRFLYQMSRV